MSTFRNDHAQAVHMHLLFVETCAMQIETESDDDASTSVLSRGRQLASATHSTVRMAAYAHFTHVEEDVGGVFLSDHVDQSRDLSSPRHFEIMQDQTPLPATPTFLIGEETLIANNRPCCPESICSAV